MATELSEINLGLIPVTRKCDLVLTIGTFDGVHLGHRHLVQQVARRAKERGCLSGAITFHPHPRAVVTGHGPASLSTLDERLAMLRGLGLDLVVALPFTQDLARLRAFDFMRLLCRSVRLRELWVGSSFALGCRREGTVARLAEIGSDLGYQVHAVAPLALNGQIVSSTLIRELIRQGRVEAAARMLGRRYHVSGIAGPEDQPSHGPGLGARSVVVSDGLALPACGVYAAHVRSGDGAWPSVVHVQAGPGSMGRLAVSARGLPADLRGQALEVEFVRRLEPGVRTQPLRAPVEKAQTQALSAA